MSDIDDFFYKHTFVGRIVDWFCDHEHYDEERAILLEEARRLKLKTDLQEARIARRLKRQTLTSEPPMFKPIATYRQPMSLNNTMTTLVLSLCERTVEDSLERQVIVKNVINDKGAVVSANMGQCFAWFKTQPVFTDMFEPWIHGVKKTSDLKERAKWDFKLKVHL